MSDTEMPADVMREVSAWLRSIARDVRLAGDVPLVRLDAEGVAPAGISLADELWLAAFRLDPRLDEEIADG